LDSLREAIRAVLDVALGDGGDQAATERLVRAAAARGDQRRVQGVGDDALLREYHALRTTFWRYLLNACIPSAEALTDRALRSHRSRGERIRERITRR
jgi:hypothetical protein